MNIQSLSVVIPAPCPNACPFCVARLNKFNSDFSVRGEMSHTAREAILRRMNFARDNGCNTLMLASTGEPFMNIPYLNDVLALNRLLNNPFKWIELQTSGYGVLENFTGEVAREVSWVSLSMVDPLWLAIMIGLWGLNLTHLKLFQN